MGFLWKFWESLTSSPALQGGVLAIPLIIIGCLIVIVGYVVSLWFRGFSRKLWQCFFGWRIEPERDENKLKNAGAIVALSFGGRHKRPTSCDELEKLMSREFNRMGISNCSLGKVVEKYRKLCNFVIFQWEICAARRDSPWEYIIWKYGQEGLSLYLDTRGVLREARWVYGVSGLDKPIIIVAHPHHLWRVVKTAEKIGFHVLTADTSDVPYDPLSIQWWTRGPVRFAIREIPTRLYCLLRGWI